MDYCVFFYEILIILKFVVYADTNRNRVNLPDVLGVHLWQLPLKNKAMSART